MLEPEGLSSISRLQLSAFCFQGMCYFLNLNIGRGNASSVTH